MELDWVLRSHCWICLGIPASLPGESEVRYMNIKNSASRGQISRDSRQRLSLAMENVHFTGTSLSCWAGNPSNRREDATLRKIK